jgi:hypothetical protein
MNYIYHLTDDNGVSFVDMGSWKDKYDWVGDFYDGRAGVELNEKWGFVNVDGNEITPLKYDDVGYFHEGKAHIKLNEKFGFVDLQGNEIIPLKYDWVGDFFNGRAHIKFMDIEGEIDLNGKAYFKQENLAKLRKHRMNGIMDSI